MHRTIRFKDRALLSTTRALLSSDQLPIVNNSWSHDNDFKSDDFDPQVNSYDLWNPKRQIEAPLNPFANDRELENPSRNFAFPADEPSIKEDVASSSEYVFDAAESGPFDWQFGVELESSDSSEKLKTPDWAQNFPLPDFIPNAAVNPFVAQFDLPTKEDIASRRSRWLISLLDIPSQYNRKKYQKNFAILFADYPYASTFKTLSELAIEGTSAESIFEAYLLKLSWAENPPWWSTRRRVNKQINFYRGYEDLPWTKACLLVEEACGVSVQQLIEAEWLDDWINLPHHDPLFWRFIDYLEERVFAYSQGTLDAGPFLRRYLKEELIIDGCSINDNYSRTGALIRAKTDYWVRTSGGTERNDILTPTKTAQ